MKLATLFLIVGSVICLSCNNKEIESKSEGTQIAIEKEAKMKKETPINREMASLGEKMFILCDACHSLKKGDAHKTGPNLHNIFGSGAALKEGFAYSEALKASDVIWNDDNMRQWISTPMEFIPNSNMAFVGIKKKEQQDALIEYLREQTK